MRAAGTAEVGLSGVKITGGWMGVYVQGAELTLDRVTISGNANATASNINGVGMRIDPGSKVLIKRSAIIQNVGTQTGGNGNGAGIHSSNAQLDIRSSTIADNTVTSSSTAYGGGIYVYQGKASLRHVTLSGNRATASTAAQEGGNLYVSGGEVTTTDSIITGGISGGGAENCGGNKPVASGRNLDSGTTCALGAGQLNATAAQLGSLGLAGGQTDALLPAVTSPVLGQATTCPDDGVDQRGAPAPTGAGCDIGAVELSSDLGVTLSQSRTEVAPGGDVTYIAKVTNSGFDPAEAATLDVTSSGGAVVTAVPSVGSCTTAVRCELGTVGAGAQVTVTIVLRAGASGTVTAAASVASATPGASSADDSASASVTITGGDVNTPPVLSGLKLSGKARAGKPIKLITKLSEPAKLSIRIARLVPGRKSGTRCSTKARHGKRCTMVRSVGSLSASGRAGKVTLTVPAKVARRTLAPGRYRITVQAIDGGGLRSAARTLAVTVSRN